MPPLRMRPATWAIVGVGSHGTEHVKQYSKLPSARLAALSDVDTFTTRLKSARTLTRTFASLLPGGRPRRFDTSRTAPRTISGSFPLSGYSLSCLPARRRPVIRCRHLPEHRPSSTTSERAKNIAQHHRTTSTSRHALDSADQFGWVYLQMSLTLMGAHFRIFQHHVLTVLLKAILGCLRGWKPALSSRARRSRPSNAFASDEPADVGRDHGDRWMAILEGRSLPTAGPAHGRGWGDETARQDGPCGVLR